MALYKQYEGSFVAVNGCIWYVELWHEAQSAYTTVGELQFPASEPLTIEWDSDKRDTIVGSTATLKIVSPGDRTYLDLYTVAAGSVFMKVFRKKANGIKHLFWVGSLDTEFYEEPFSREKNYDVSLTFSDFGLLKRICFDVANAARIEYLQDLVEKCVEQATGGYIASSNIVVQCSTETNLGSGMISLFDKLGIRSDNFVDEDGEISTLSDVLEGILKPLALRIEQRAGKVFIYDFNAIATANNSQEIRWAGTDQRLSIDETANKITVTFSTYAQGELTDGKIDDVVGISGYSGTVTRYRGMNFGNNENYDSWRYHLRSGVLPSQLQSLGCSLIKIEPIIDGDEQVLIAAAVPNYIPDAPTYDEWDYETDGWRNGANYLVNPFNGSTPSTKVSLFKTVGIPINAEGNSGKLLLTMKMLLDSRYNPFADADDTYNRQDSSIDKYCNAVYVNCRIKCGDYYLVNNPSETPVVGYYYKGLTGEWVIPDGPLPSNWSTNAEGYIYSLMWYELDGLKTADNSCPTTNLSNNREPFGNKLEVTERLAMRFEGVIITPPVPGELTIEVFNDIRIMDGNDGYAEGGSITVESTPYHKIRWWLMEAPKLEYVDITAGDTKAETHKSNDIEESGVINALAKDDISIDTICGTTPDSVARGAYYIYRNSGWHLLTSNYCYRANRLTSSLEQLLIGTLYSQYAGRHLKLTGTANIPDFNDSEYSIFTEACYNDKTFICVSEVCNCIADECEVTLVELSADSYTTV